MTEKLPDPVPCTRIIDNTVLFERICFRFAKIFAVVGGSSHKSFSALLLGGLFGIGLFKRNQLQSVVKIKGHAVTKFSQGTFFEEFCITSGARPWPIMPPKTGARPENIFEIIVGFV